MSCPAQINYRTPSTHAPIKSHSCAVVPCRSLIQGAHHIPRVNSFLNNSKINSYFIESPDNPYIKDNSIWLTSLNFQPNDAMDCITKVNCSLPFSIHELDKKTFKLKNKYTFSKTVFGLPTVAVPINKTVYMGSFHADRLGSFKIK